MDENSSAAKPRLQEAAREYWRLGILSFGGSAAQIALMHKMFVDEKPWLSEKQYLSALSFCLLLPGPEAMQLSTYIGWKLHGVRGGLIAGLLFVLPGAVIMLVLVLLYAYFGAAGWLEATFLGIKSAVLVIVIEALLRLSKRALISRKYWIISLFSFVGIFVFEVPYPLIVVAAALFGFVSTAPEKADHASRGLTGLVSWRSTLRTILFWLAVWFLPLLVIALGTEGSFYGDIGVFFSKLATVTFGGAYAVLAYMSQEVVFELGWLAAPQMIDGLGLAETTPGPLILVTEFVGFMAGFQHGGPWAALAAALLTLWVTFVPCFLWIFAGAPYIEWISEQPRLRSALSAITAAVVGVILSLSLWFGLQVLFGSVEKLEFGPAKLWLPDFTTLNLTVMFLACLSFYLLIIRHVSLLYVLALSACLGFALGMLTR